MERRHYPRVEVSHSVLYFSPSYPRPKVNSTVDLSMGGSRIETPYSLIKGERLEIVIDIHPQVIKCKGEVIHVSDLKGEGPEAGVRFEKMSKKDRQYLGAYLSSVMEHLD